MSRADKQDKWQRQTTHRREDIRGDRLLFRKGIRKGFDKNGGVICKGCFALKLEIDRLREELKRLRDALKQRSTTPFGEGAHTPSSKVSFKANSDEEKKASRGGAKPGHRGHGREAATPLTADRIVDLPRQEQCEDCECRLNQRDVRSRTVLEALPIKAEKVLYRMERGICPKCFKTYAPSPPALPKSFYGNRLTAQAAVMHFVHGIPIGKVLAIFGDEVTEGGLIDVFHRLGRICESAMPELISDYRKSDVRHADETGWRTDGSGGYAWIFATTTTSVFDFANTRSSRIAAKVLGHERLGGVLVVDRYGGYNRAPVKLQYCYAHLLRETTKLEDEFADNAEVVAFVAEFATLLATAMKLRGQRIEDDEYYCQARDLQSRIEIAANAPAKHLGIRRIQDIFIRNKHRLYHWVTSREVPPDNNRAERELRPTVIARKVSFGSQSEAGAKTRSNIMSVLFTARKRFKDIAPENWLKSALDHIAQKPDASIYSLLSSTPSN